MSGWSRPGELGAGLHAQGAAHVRLAEVEVEKDHRVAAGGGRGCEVHGGGGLAVAGRGARDHHHVRTSLGVRAQLDHERSERLPHRGQHVPAGGLAAAQLARLEERDPREHRERVERHRLVLVPDPALRELEEQGGAGAEREAGQRREEHDHRHRGAARRLGLRGRLRERQRGVAVDPHLLERVDPLGHGGRGLGAFAEVVLTGPQALHLGGGLPGDDVPAGGERLAGEGVCQLLCLGRVVRLRGDREDVALALRRDADRVEHLLGGPVAAQLAAVRSAAAVDLMRVAAVCAVRVGIAGLAHGVEALELRVLLRERRQEDVRGGLVARRAQGDPRDGRADRRQHHERPPAGGERGSRGGTARARPRRGGSERRCPGRSSEESGV